MLTDNSQSTVSKNSNCSQILAWIGSFIALVLLPLAYPSLTDGYGEFLEVLFFFIYIGIGLAALIFSSIVFIRSQIKQKSKTNIIGISLNIFIIILIILFIWVANYNSKINHMRYETPKTLKERQQLAQGLIDAYAAYKQDHGVYPDDLDEVVPDYYRPANYKKPINIPFMIHVNYWPGGLAFKRDKLYDRLQICYQLSDDEMSLDYTCEDIEK
ncbi:MAG: hypothetical protein UT11_C0071G0008 [Berkelbacteria bacterium GW2011_GWA2_38_9]|uniref:Uncharacterized protein n=1 Tax=Berkelbacteria bacterium GW2011_GWA2_38_9 TaxID=1618334 RepID=A0A0G0NKJ4_9BACT|nr:MAG: hypothetical protein UT11_C0071G0008 [Berkelbacteria bacterium GW2011_GWA2_38_9]